MDNFEEKYFEITLSFPDAQLKKAYVIARDRTEAVRKAKTMDPTVHIHFRAFRLLFFHLKFNALLFSDWDKEYCGHNILTQKERNICFEEGLLRVFMKEGKIDDIDQIAWMIVSLTIDIIDYRNEQKISRKKKK